MSGFSVIVMHIFETFLFFQLKCSYCTTKSFGDDCLWREIMRLWWFRKLRWVILFPIYIYIYTTDNFWIYSYTCIPLQSISYLYIQWRIRYACLILSSSGLYILYVWSCICIYGWEMGIHLLLVIYNTWSVNPTR